MEETTISNNNPDYTMGYTRESSEINPVYTDEEKREAICKRCGAVWHPRKTDARRPTRCPYCHSHRTEWLNQHPELLDSKADNLKEDVDAEVETEDEEWHNPDYSMEESMEDTGISQDYTEDETDEGSSDNDTKTDYTAGYPRDNLGTNPDYTRHSKQKGIPIAALYLILGVMLTYGLIRVWNYLRKPVQKKETDSRPAETAFSAKNMTAPFMTETRHMGLAEMAMKQHHLL